MLSCVVLCCVVLCCVVVVVVVFVGVEVVAVVEVFSSSGQCYTSAALGVCLVRLGTFSVFGQGAISIKLSAAAVRCRAMGVLR